MKSSPEHYQPFLSVPVREHCESQIEPYGVEIDHVGLMALIDCLILPAGMAVEIIYLDRSAGDEVNVHRFEKLEGEGILTAPDAPVLRLLYRPYASPTHAQSRLNILSSPPPSCIVATTTSCTKRKTCQCRCPRSRSHHPSPCRFRSSTPCRTRSSRPRLLLGAFQASSRRRSDWISVDRHPSTTRSSHFRVRTQETSASRCCRFPSSSPHRSSRCRSRRPRSGTHRSTQVTSKVKTFSRKSTSRQRRQPTPGNMTSTLRIPRYKHDGWCARNVNG